MDSGKKSKSECLQIFACITLSNQFHHNVYFLPKESIVGNKERRAPALVEATGPPTHSTSAAVASPAASTGRDPEARGSAVFHLLPFQFPLRLYYQSYGLCHAHLRRPVEAEATRGHDVHDGHHPMEDLRLHLSGNDLIGLH